MRTQESMAGSGPTTDHEAKLGHSLLKYFPLDPNYKNLNHGSFGTYPNVVVDERQNFRKEFDSNPDAFIRYNYPKHNQRSRAALAKYLNVHTDELVYVKNATTGVNLVLRNLEYKPGDIIVYFSCIYGACEKTIAFLAEKTPLQARKVMLEFPCTHEEIVQKWVDVVRKARADGLNVTVSLFDTIVSQPGVRFPFEQLVELCREEGILSCLDAAHGVGQIPLDLAKLNPDFLVSNCHKWLYTPRGCAVFYVPARNQHLIRCTLATSWGYQPVPDALRGALPDPSQAVNFRSVLPSDGSKSAFEMLFEFVATDDDTAYLCVPASLKFRQEVCGGEVRIMEYCEKLAFDAGNAVARILGTEVLCEPGAEAQNTFGASQIRRCAMVNVRLPIGIDNGNEGSSKGGSLAVIKATSVDPLSRWIEQELMDNHHTIVPIFPLGNSMWTRLSAQIYLELEDFEWLGNVMKGICERLTKGECPSGLEIDFGNLKLN